MALSLNRTDEGIEDTITTVLASITGLDPDKGEIRIAYGQDGYPSWTHNDNVITYYLSPVQDEYGEDVIDDYLYKEKRDKFDKTTSFTQVMDCNLSIYGPDCRSLATLIRTGILADENRLALSRDQIYPVPKTPPCRYVPYEFNSQWWKRADVTIRLNVFTKLQSEIDRIHSVKIKVITTETGEKDVDITS